MNIIFNFCHTRCHWILHYCTFNIHWPLSLLILLELYFSIAFIHETQPNITHNKMSQDMAAYNLKLRGRSNDCLWVSRAPLLGLERVIWMKGGVKQRDSVSMRNVFGLHARSFFAYITYIRDAHRSSQTAVVRDIPDGSIISCWTLSGFVYLVLPKSVKCTHQYHIV